VTDEISDQILREASAWFARLHSDDVSAQDHVRLADWLAVRAEHREAYAFVTETCRLRNFQRRDEIGRHRADGTEARQRTHPSGAPSRPAW